MENEKYKVSQLYYIDILPLQQKELHNKNGTIVLSPAEILKETLSSEDALVVFCELEEDEKGKPKSVSDWYGIKLVQKIRRQGFKGKVLFISWADLDFIVGNELVKTIGHGFYKLPHSATEWKIIFETNDEDSDLFIQLLDDLSLYDIQHHFCDIRGILNEQLHHLRSIFQNKECLTNEDKQKCVFLIRNVFKSVNVYVENVVSEFLNHSLNADDAIDYIRKKCISVLPPEKNDGDTHVFMTPKWKAWKVLWLDDEVDESNVLVEKLKERGVEVLLAKNYKEAEFFWVRDRLTIQEICLIIADYRLKEGQECRKKQGYHFLKYIADLGLGIGLMAYSGLPRKFLIESFKYYGIQVTILSKIDFDLKNKSAVRFMIEEILRLGDEHWELRNNQPFGKYWSVIRPIYHEYKNSYSYYTHQKRVAAIVARNLSQFIRKFNLAQTDKELWELQFEDTFDFPTNANIPKNQDEWIKNKIILCRRIVIGVYAFLRSEKNQEIEQDDQLDYLRYVVTNSTKNKIKLIGKTFNKSKLVKAIKTNKSFHTKLSYLALTFDGSWPLGLLPEEYAWIQFDTSVGISQDKIETYWYEIIQIRDSFQKLFQSDKFFVELLETKKITIRKNNKIDVLKIEVGKHELYFKDNLTPYLRTVGETKALIEFLVYCFKKLRKERQSVYTLFIKFLIQLRKWSSKTSVLVRTLEYFINSISSLEDRSVQLTQRKETLIEEYYRLYEPWWFYRPNERSWGRGEYIQQEYKYREKLFLAACQESEGEWEKQIGKICNGRKQKIEEYKFRYDLRIICRNIFQAFNGENYPTSATERKHFAIYYGILSFKLKRNSDRKKAQLFWDVSNKQGNYTKKSTQDVIESMKDDNTDSLSLAGFYFYAKNITYGKNFENWVESYLVDNFGQPEEEKVIIVLNGKIINQQFNCSVFTIDDFYLLFIDYSNSNRNTKQNILTAPDGVEWRYILIPPDLLLN